MVASYCTELLRLNAQEQAESRHIMRSRTINDELLELYGRTRQRIAAITAGRLAASTRQLILLRLGTLKFTHQLWVKPAITSKVAGLTAKRIPVRAGTTAQSLRRHPAQHQCLPKAFNY